MNNFIETVIEVKGLTKIFGKGCPSCVEGTGPDYNTNICPYCKSIVACSNISFKLFKSEILGIVGESGSGKSTLLKCLYLEQQPTDGEYYLNYYKEGKVNIFQLDSQEKRYIKNNLLGMVYQYPHLGLDMYISCGGNIAEKLINSGYISISKIRKRASELLNKTEIPLLRIDDFPKNFSGGMQQRVQIAKALSNNPPILFLDEITSGLDVSVQAKVLDLIKSIQQELKISMLIVSHDMSVIRMLADRTIVMKNGKIVEMGLTDQILEDPQHPYTQLLISSIL
ncbi:ATP-binding cassette domain-containing protein [Caldicellulosiruptor morganii]|uniref:ATP-binding cassette domain-containing protein n=1 Tax=Caldicellulosiruptor morganii TaxID=1387555 RepID=A0ABY7BN55_9FIRM|nr:ATP-binding cassette domain-containing protein [Caldicellulosiruptor morganii]WAM33476.1 ATP-binding cassette domain-containing protein [Caldicellulosiruptor morganii]